MIFWFCAGLAAAADLGTVSLASAEESVAAQACKKQASITVARQLALSVPSKAQALLQSKIAERDRLQREIDALQAETKAPEQIVVKLRLLEVNLTKMRDLGLDYSAMLRRHFRGADAILNAAGPNGGSPQDSDAKFQMGIANDSIGNCLDSLEQKNCARVLAEPTVVVVSGRPASIHVGGEIPVPSGDKCGVEFRKYGTQLELMAQAVGNNRLRIEARPRVSEVENHHAIQVADVKVPGMSVREIDTAIELESGQTWLMSGLVQERVVTVVRGTGTEDRTEKIALVVSLTPEIVR